MLEHTFLLKEGLWRSEGEFTDGAGMRPDGAWVFVSNGRAASVSVIDARRFVKLKDIPVGELPWGVVIR